jgi:predicted patatin/cPLA2 family phospholipase
VLNGLLVAATPIGQEKLAAQRLSNIYMTIEAKNIYADWGFPYIASGFINKGSFLDSSPETPYIERVFKELGGKFYRKINIGICNANDGTYLSVNESVGVNRIPFYVTASSAMPGIFSYVIEGNKVYVDGGTINNLNLRNGIDSCLQFVKEEDIIIDLIMTNPCKPFVLIYAYSCCQEIRYD